MSEIGFELEPLIDWPGTVRTSFVDRRAEIAEVKDLVSTQRLVTLVGVAGGGKTRLARRAAAQLRGAFRHGVWLVELTSVRDPALVPHTIAMALDAPIRSPWGPTEDLIEFLRRKQLLLVVDDCEHLRDACAEVVNTLLRAAPGLRVLVTSRHDLGLFGEHRLTVRPLPTPVSDGDVTADNPALTLFTERAAAVAPEFTLTGDNRSTVAEICRELDGIPLAIELAARRLPHLSLDQLLFGLHRLEPPLASDADSTHHQSMRAALDWSFDLCSASEQLLWARASVFPSSFTLDAAERVCASDDLVAEDLLHVVTGLVENSILVAEESFGTMRYRLLPTVREYGRDRLDSTGQHATAARAHRDWCLQLAEQCEADWFGPHQVEAFTRIQAAHADVRDALDFCLTHPEQASTGLRLAAALWFYWIACGALPEGRYWLDRALAVNPAPSPTRAKALWVNSWIASLQGNITLAITLAERCQTYGRQHGDDLALGHGTRVLGNALLLADDLPQAATVLADAQQLLTQAQARHTDDAALDSATVLAAAQLATARALQGDLPEAITLCDQADQQCQQWGEQWVRSQVLYVRALVEWHSDGKSRAATHARECMRTRPRYRDQLGVVMNLELLAWIAAAEGTYQRAAVLLGAAQHLWQPLGQPLFGSENWTIPHTRCETECSHNLGVHAFEAARHHGSDLTTSQAIAYAMNE